MNHTTSFSIDVAKRIGVDEAVLHDWIRHHCWTLQALGDESNLHEGKWWVQCTLESLSVALPFWSVGEIYRRLDKLTNGGIVKQRMGDTKHHLFLTDTYSPVPKIRKKRAELPVIEEPKEPEISYFRKLQDGTLEKVETTKGMLVNEIISMFGEVNKNVKSFYGQKYQREATLRLIDKYPVKDVFDMIEVLEITNSMPYAPIITTPVELERLAPKLIAFVKKERVVAKSKFKVIL